MKIELCEDNGCFREDGVPTLVILQITRDDGTIVRVPYQANRTLQLLYVDIGHMAEKAPVVTMVDKPFVRAVAEDFHKKTLDSLPDVIQREDIVKCVKLHERDPGSDCDLKVGDEYRVINIIKNNNIISFYEVLDDNSSNKIRIATFPDEIELVRKHVRPSPRKQVFEVAKTCSCGEINSLELNVFKNEYSGTCTKCGVILKEARVHVGNK